jgi:hypothetical protein
MDLVDRHVDVLVIGIVVAHCDVLVFGKPEVSTSLSTIC